MAYRAPRFVFHHAMRTAGIAALGGSAMNASYPLARVIDSSVGISAFARFNGTAANQFVKVDRGAGFAALPQPDRLIIPAGHNLNGCTVEVRHHTSDPGTGTTGTLIGTVAVTGSALVSLALSPAISNRYALVNFATAGTAWEFGELWLGVTRTLTRGPDFAWTDADVGNVSESQMRSGERYRLNLGASMRAFEFLYHALAAADRTTLRDLWSETVSGSLPFYFDETDDAASALLMMLDKGSDLRMAFEQDYEAYPSIGGPTYETRLKLTESLA